MQIIYPYSDYIRKEEMTPTQFIELIGRTCYKSTDKIADETDKTFVHGLCKSKHYAMIEHFWVHCIADMPYSDFMEDLNYFATQILAVQGRDSDLVKHIQITGTGAKTFISCPIRVVVEMIDTQNNSREWDKRTHFQWCLSCVRAYPDFFSGAEETILSTKFEWLGENDFIEKLQNYLWDKSITVRNREVMKHKTHTIKFVCDRGVSHELVRHRPCSFAQESQRYCNYSKNKFGGEVFFINPFFWSEDKEGFRYLSWVKACEHSEEIYLELLANGATPQEARIVLPNSVKTEIIVTANETEWQHIVNLRYHGTTGAPHPQMKEVMSFAYHTLREKSEGRIK